MYYVTMTDKFMSGWGKAVGRENKYVVECETAEQAEAIERAAQDRPEMQRIKTVTRKPNYDESLYLTSWTTFANMGGPWLEYYNES